MKYENIGKAIGNLVDENNKRTAIPKELVELAKENGIKYHTLRARLRKGMNPFEAATKSLMSLSQRGKLGNKTHGFSETKMYHKWENMKQRCLNKKHPQYSDYGGRGIFVCNEWLEFKSFMKWCLQNGYDDNLEIDRINNNGGYEPTNCRFVDQVTNDYNKRTTKQYEYKGKQYTMRELSKLAKIHPTTLRTRMFNGMSVKEAVEKPVQRTGRYNESFYKNKYA